MFQNLYLLKVKLILIYVSYCCNITSYSQTSTAHEIWKDSSVTNTGKGRIGWFFKSSRIDFQNGDSLINSYYKCIWYDNNEQTEIIPLKINDTIEYGVQLKGEIKKHFLYKTSVGSWINEYYRINKGDWVRINSNHHSGAWSFSRRNKSFGGCCGSVQYTFPIRINGEDVLFTLYQGDWYYKETNVFNKE